MGQTFKKLFSRDGSESDACCTPEKSLPDLRVFALQSKSFGGGMFSKSLTEWQI